MHEEGNGRADLDTLDSKQIKHLQDLCGRRVALLSNAEYIMISQILLEEDF